MDAPTIPGADVASLTALTLENIKPQVIDHIAKHLSFWFYLQQEGLVRYEDGGPVLQQPVRHAKTNCVKSYFPGEYFTIERPTGWKRLQFQWAFVGGAVAITGPEEFMNSGQYGLTKLAAEYAAAFKQDYAEKMWAMVYGDGTGNGGRDLLGLDILIEDGTTGSWSKVGGVDPDDDTWFKNYYLDASGTPWGTGADCHGIKTLKHAIRMCSQPGVGAPDALHCSLTQYEFYENALAKSLVFNQPALADERYVDAGFGGLRLLQTPCIFDLNRDTTGTLVHTWFITNKAAIQLVIGKNKAFETSAPFRHPLIDGWAMNGVFYGQMVIQNRRDCLGRVLMPSAAA